MPAYITPSGRQFWAKPSAFIRNCFMPYGMWTCENGREVLFNRFYEPIWERQNGVVKAANPKEWVQGITKQSWFYEDCRSEKAMRQKAEAALREWEIPTEYPAPSNYLQKRLLKRVAYA